MLTKNLDRGVQPLQVLVANLSSDTMYRSKATNVSGECLDDLRSARYLLGYQQFVYYFVCFLNGMKLSYSGNDAQAYIALDARKVATALPDLPPAAQAPVP